MICAAAEGRGANPGKRHPPRGRKQGKRRGHDFEMKGRGRRRLFRPIVNKRLVAWTVKTQSDYAFVIKIHSPASLLFLRHFSLRARAKEVC